MHSKNKSPMSATERTHVDAVKQMPCGLCGAAGPSCAHEPEQGLWFLSIPLCFDCHQGTRNGIHGQKVMWKLKKKSENDVLNETLRRLYGRAK